MRHKNHVSLIGTVGRDAEVRTTQGGVTYAQFSLATSSGGYQKNGQQVPEVTQWHPITAWRELATFCGQYIKKGMKVDVEGSITYSEYTDQQGQKRQRVEIVAKDIILMTMPPQQGQQNAGQGQGQGQQRAPQQQAPVNGYQQAPPQNGGYQPQQQAPQYGGGMPFPPQQPTGGGPDDLPF